MKHLFSVVAALAVASGSALAQQQYGDVGPGQFRTDIIVDLATNQAIREELSLSEEVAGKVASLRDEYRAAVQKGYKDAGINPADYPVGMTIQQQRLYREIAQKLNEEFTPKVKELLTADQNKRLYQIQFQDSLRNSVPRAFLRPHEAAELKLTNEQKQKLRTLSSEFFQNAYPSGKSTGSSAKFLEEYGGKAIEVLTAEQRETLNQLMGDLFDHSRLVPRTPRVPRPRQAPPGKGNDP